MSKESPGNEVVKGVALTCAKLELTFGYHGNELTHQGNEMTRLSLLLVRS